MASLPHLTHDGDLDRPTAIISTVETGGYLAAPAIGGVALVATSPEVVLLIEPPSSPRPRSSSRASGARSPPAPPRAWWTGWPGVRLVADRRRARRPPRVVLVSLMGGVVSVLVVPMATDQLGSDSAGTGMLVAALGTGALLGAGLAAWRTTWSPAASLAMAGGPLVLAAPVAKAGLVVVLLAVAGAAPRSSRC